MRKALIAIAIVGGILAMGAPAGAFPQGVAPTVTCDKLSIDPPPAPFIKVTFSGTINGEPYSRTVQYGAPTPHIATVDISDLTTATGPLHITATAEGGFLGTSETADKTITCHEAATTTTATTAPRGTSDTTVSPTTVLEGGTGELPTTGSSTGWFLLAGGACAVSGGLLVVPRRRSLR